MAQFNIDVDSGIIRISQLICGICPGMSQATLFSSNSSFVAPALNSPLNTYKGTAGTFLIDRRALIPGKSCLGMPLIRPGRRAFVLDPGPFSYSLVAIHSMFWSLGLCVLWTEDRTEPSCWEQDGWKLAEAVVGRTGSLEL